MLKLARLFCLFAILPAAAIGQKLDTSTNREARKMPASDERMAPRVHTAADYGLAYCQEFDWRTFPTVGYTAFRMTNDGLICPESSLWVARRR